MLPLVVLWLLVLSRRSLGAGEMMIMVLLLEVPEATTPCCSEREPELDGLKGKAYLSDCIPTRQLTYTDCILMRIKLCVVAIYCLLTIWDLRSIANLCLVVGCIKYSTHALFLRAAFALPFESLVETAAKFPSSATGKPASPQHVKDCKLCAAQILREQTRQHTRKVFWPVDRWEYVVQSMCFDEASFKVAAAGEKPMESPCLGSACALLAKPVDKGPELVNLHGPLVVMKDKPEHSEIPSLNSKCCLKSLSFANSFFSDSFLSSVSVY